MLLYDMATDHGGSDGRRFTAREMQLIFERAGEADVAAQGEQGFARGDAGDRGASAAERSTDDLG